MMEAGFANLDPVAKYIVQTCFLADQFKVRPSEVHRWNSRDRMLMLAYYKKTVEIQEEDIDRASRGLPAKR